MLEHHVVVGVDGSVVSTRALDAAADESASRSVPLEIVYAVPDPDVAGPVLTTSADRVAARHPGLPVRLTAVAADPATALVARGSGAALVVVGTRALGPVASMASRSVAQRVAGRSRCPVLVVGPGCPSAHVEAGEVVFAVGSDDDIDAAGFAFEEAVRRGVRLRFVHTARYRPSSGARCPAAETAGHDHGWPAPAPGPDGELISATAGADVVVVAHHQHGGRGHTRTVRALLHHARCPVLLAPVGPSEP